MEEDLENLMTFKLDPSANLHLKEGAVPRFFACQNDFFFFFYWKLSNQIQIYSLYIWFYTLTKKFRAYERYITVEITFAYVAVYIYTETFFSLIKNKLDAQGTVFKKV